MLRPSPNHGTQRLPNDDDVVVRFQSYVISAQMLLKRYDLSKVIPVKPLIV